MARRSCIPLCNFGCIRTRASCRGRTLTTRRRQHAEPARSAKTTMHWRAQARSVVLGKLPCPRLTSLPCRNARARAIRRHSTHPVLNACGNGWATPAGSRISGSMSCGCHVCSADMGGRALASTAAHRVRSPARPSRPPCKCVESPQAAQTTTAVSRLPRPGVAPASHVSAVMTNACAGSHAMNRRRKLSARSDCPSLLGSNLVRSARPPSGVSTRQASTTSCPSVNNAAERAPAARASGL